MSRYGDMGPHDGMTQYLGSGRTINFGGLPIHFRKPEPPPRKPPPESPFVLGLDLGQSNDPTALAIVERTAILGADGKPAKDYRGRDMHRHHVVHMAECPLNTPYPAIIESVRLILGWPGLVPTGPEVQKTRLAIDASGVGRPIVDMFLGAGLPAQCVPVTITADEGSRHDSWNRTNTRAYRVAKKELVGTVRAGLESGSLTIDPALPRADLLRAELFNFKVKVTDAAHETFNAREGKHDDLVLAVALAVWVAENVRVRYSVMFG